MVHHEFRFKLTNGREEAGLTPEEMDAKLGLESGAVQAWEDGTRAKPGEAMVAMLAAAIGKPASYLDPDRFDKALSDHAEQFAAVAIDRRMSEGRAEALWNAEMAKPGYRGALPREEWEAADEYQTELDL